LELWHAKTHFFNRAVERSGKIVGTAPVESAVILLFVIIGFYGGWQVVKLISGSLFSTESFYGLNLFVQLLFYGPVLKK